MTSAHSSLLLRARRTVTAVLAAGVVCVAAASLSACSSDPLADQYRAGSGKNYIAGDGSVTEIAPENRGEPIVFSGTTIDDEKLASKDLAGQVVVVNFWYAGCAPCRQEAPDLEAVKLAQSAAGAPVTFVGINVRDQAATAASFNSTFGISYPALTDQNGSIQLAFSSSVPPNAVPTTLILDAQGRVAARILGALADRSILVSLIDSVLAETNK
jgi:thiol-disulfide isomerase/thioredoxin